MNITEASLYEPLLAPLLRPMRETMLNLLESAGCRTLADICCGPGGFAAMAVKRGFAVVGLDLDRAMLDEASDRVPKGILVMGDASSPPFTGNSFDAAAISMALHAMPLKKAESAFNEALRIAGLVVAADYRLAERNLDLPSVGLGAGVERLVGGEHWRNYKIFMSKGGLEGLLHRLNAKVLQRRNALLGAGVCVLAKRT